MQSASFDRNELNWYAMTHLRAVSQTTGLNEINDSSRANLDWNATLV